MNAGAVNTAVNDTNGTAAPSHGANAITNSVKSMLQYFMDDLGSVLQGLSDSASSDNYIYSGTNCMARIPANVSKKKSLPPLSQ